MIKRKEEREKRSERYRGIRVRKWGKWVSEIRLPKTQKRLWLGTYETAEEAARAFDMASYCIHGRLTFLNFPNSPPVLNIPRGIRFSTKQIKAAAIQAASAPKSLSCGTDDHKKDECIPCVHSEFEPPEHNQIMSEFFESFLWGSPNDQVSSAIYISAYLGVVLMIDCVIPYGHCCSTHEVSEELYGLWSS